MYIECQLHWIINARMDVKNKCIAYNVYNIYILRIIV